MKHLVKGILVGAAALFAVGVGHGCESHDAVFNERDCLRAMATELRGTIVAPHLEAAIGSGRNVLWCGTFQLAWNEACDVAGGQLQLDPPSQVADALNRKGFSRDDLDDASYVAVAGLVRDGVFERIDRQLNARFGGRARPALKPRREITARPQDMVAYAYLFKHLEFATPFERLDTPLEFAGSSVASFGMGWKPNEAREAMAQQVEILHYAGKDDLVIELKTKSQGDHLILAKIQPEATMAETIASAQARIAKRAPVTAQGDDVLMVPRVNFDITRDYSELTGRRLVPTKAGMADDLQLLSAVQGICFEMDEKGVRLKSEATMRFGCAASARVRPEHIMIFDRPYLILMVRTGARAPHFALWVANPELLVPAR